jgi:hypothetical protein
LHGTLSQSERVFGKLPIAKNPKVGAITKSTGGVSMSSALEHLGPRPRVGQKPAGSPLFDAFDQPGVRADLATFFGPRADVYLNTYDKMRAAKDTKRWAVRTWNWPVFLGSFTWFFYRKMYGVGAILVLLPMASAYLLGTTGGIVSVFFAMGAKSWYVNAGLARIAKADAQGLTGAARADYLQRAGGVSLTAGLLARRHHIGH